MQARVLGNLSLHENGNNVPPPGGIVGKLLRILLLRPNEYHPAEILVESLWPDAPADMAKRRLHVTVSRLRDYLGDKEYDSGSLHVLSGPEGYRLGASAASLDRLVFESLAERALAAGDVDEIEAALEVWGGEPYAGFDWTPEARTQRSRLTDLYQTLVAAKMKLTGGPGAEEGFLRAKLRAPRIAQQSLLTRSRLLASTPSVGQVQVLSVTAPAGFGKSVFLAQWANVQSVPVAWVSLEEGDNDPARFWSAVVAAITEAGRSDLGEAFQELRAGSVAFLDALSDVFDAGSTPVAIVLDDFHVVTEPVVHKQVATLISVLPISSTVAFGSRAELPFATAKLAATGHLHRLIAPDLSFTVEEVEALVGDRAKAESLWAFTEGWPVAVVVLRQTTESAGAAPPEMSSYLVEELLATLPPDAARFLTKVAHLDRFNRALGDAVTEMGDSGEMITLLQHHQALVLETGAGGEWQRVHQLIAHELRRRARAEGVDASRLWRRAARWFLHEGMKEESLEYAVRARDKELISATAGDVLVGAAFRQEALTCARWLRQVDPDDLIGDLRGHSIGMGLASIWGLLDVRRKWQLSRMRHFGGEDDVVLLLHDAVVSVREGRATEAVASLEKVINEASSYASEVAPDLVPVLVGIAFSYLVEGRMFQDTLRPDDPIFASAIGLTRSSAPLVAAYIHSAWSLVSYVAGHDDRGAAHAEEFFLGRRSFEIGFHATPENSIVGAVRAAQRTDDPERLQALANGLDGPVRYYQDVGQHTWLAAAALVAAAICRRAGRPGEAQWRQLRADGLLSTFPDAPFLERLASRVDGIVAVQRVSDQKLIDLLSPRERTVLTYLGTDLSIQQIARALHVSPSTVRSHASSIYRKLDVRGRHQAILRFGSEVIASLDPA